jgi:hypothetical protein
VMNEKDKEIEGKYKFKKYLWIDANKIVSNSEVLHSKISATSVSIEEEDIGNEETTKVDNVYVMKEADEEIEGKYKF